MSVNRRYQIALQAKLCIACHHPDYVFKKNDKDHKCSVVNSKKKGDSLARPAAVMFISGSVQETRILT